MCRDAREYVLSCGCRRRKRSRSQHLAMLPARFLEPSEVLEVDLQKVPNTSEAGNEYLLLGIDKASKFPFAYPLPSKEAHGVARLLLDLCLTFGVPSFIRADGGGGIHGDSNGTLMWVVEGTDKVCPGRSPQGPRKCREGGSLDAGCVIRALQSMAEEVGRIRCR